MKLLKAGFQLLFAASLLNACGTNGNKVDDKGNRGTKSETISAGSGAVGRLEGAWEIKRAEGTAAKTNVGTVYEFKGSKLIFSKDGFVNPGNTVITDTTFSFQAEGNKFKFIYNYKFNGDTLVAEMQNSGGQLLHMVKQ